MQEPNDHELLAQFTRQNSEAAFAALVSRHVNLVYSVALRKTGRPAAAEEIAQAVFIILARKARGLPPRTILAGWLCETARLTAANYLRTEIRRQNREQEAHMQSLLNEPPADEVWKQITPLLDDALAKLGAPERNAVVLRFFENKNLRDVGTALGVSEDAAKRRVHRALEKMRKIFLKRGVTLSALALSGMLAANSVQAAPVALAAAISATAVQGMAATASTLTLVKGALKLMVWAKVKAAILVGASALLVAGTATVIVTENHGSGYLSWQVFDMDKTDSIIKNTPPQVRIVPTKFPEGDGSGNWRWTTVEGGLDGKLMGMNSTAGEIMRIVCSEDDHTISRERTASMTNLPDEDFDFIANLPAGSKAALRAEAKKVLGLVGRLEARQHDALLLKVNDGAAGTKARTVLNGVNTVGEGDMVLRAANTGDLAKQLDAWVRLPVIDRTGITNDFTLTLNWSAKPGNTNSEDLKQALLNDLGLELVPAHEPVEMLVIEKVK